MGLSKWEKDPQEFYSGCAGKISHGSAIEAHKALSNLKDKKHTKVYRCEFCSRWHFGRSNRRQSKIK